MADNPCYGCPVLHRICDDDLDWDFDPCSNCCEHDVSRDEDESDAEWEERKYFAMIENGGY